jgi:hypothetical protein
VAIQLETLRTASRRVTKTASRTLREARQEGLRTLFLCHSHLDAEYVSGLITLLDDHNWRVYVDWRDNAMPESPNGETAKVIRQKIRDLDYFAFLATPNSVSSRWCPWEIGYADGVKRHEQIFVIPTEDQSGRWYGREYLQVYQRVDIGEGQILGVWQPNSSQGVRLNSL